MVRWLCRRRPRRLVRRQANIARLLNVSPPTISRLAASSPFAPAAAGIQEAVTANAAMPLVAGEGPDRDWRDAAAKCRRQRILYYCLSGGRPPPW